MNSFKERNFKYQWRSQLWFWFRSTKYVKILLKWNVSKLLLRLHY